MAAFVVSVAAAADVSLLACAYMTGQVQVHKHHMWLVAPDCTVGCKPLPAVLVKTQGMILKQSGQPASQPVFGIANSGQHQPRLTCMHSSQFQQLGFNTH